MLKAAIHPTDYFCFTPCIRKEIIMAYQNGEVRNVTLKNQGGFVVELDFKVKALGRDDKLDGTGKDITLGCSETVDPGDFGVKDGDTFCVLAHVIMGKNNTSDWLTYKKESDRTAKFVISGTTLDNTLSLHLYDGCGMDG